MKKFVQYSLPQSPPPQIIRTLNYVKFIILCLLHIYNYSLYIYM